MKYYRAYFQEFASETEKAVAITIYDGFAGRHDEHKWLPKSQIMIGEPNECGWKEVLIPAWLINKNHIKINMVNEFNFENGADYIVER